MSEGLFITFEGGEGGGKTSQSLLLAERLRSLGQKVVLTREPGGTELGKYIRKALVGRTDDPPSSRAELFLYAADRAHHVEKVISPALDAGKVVLCDRFTDATLAYQGYGRGIDLGVINTLNELATGGLKPHRTLWFDLDPEIGLRRSLERENGRGTGELRFEEEALDFHLRVRSGYAEICLRNPERCRRVDCRGSVEEVAKKVWLGVSDLFGGEK
ncbi:dTMP kinase [bacterium]|nr:MAG: dTMP kinase [bacterium]